MAGKGVQQKYNIAEIVKMCEEKYKIVEKNVISNLLRGYQTQGSYYFKLTKSYHFL